MKFERDKMDSDLQMKAAEVKKASSDVNEDEEGEDNKEGSVASSHICRRIGVEGPRMSCFDEMSDGIDSFCIDLKFMQIVKDEVKDTGQYICQQCCESVSVHLVTYTKRNENNTRPCDKSHQLKK